jgi:UDP-N-acetyl-D-mannosaminuronate dehydrogenase
VKETISSPALRLAEELASRGTRVLAEDPCFTARELEALGLTPWEGESVDLTIVATDHDEYREIDWGTHPGSLVVDGRNTLDRAAVESAGHRYLGIGRP